MHREPSLLFAARIKYKPCVVFCDGHFEFSTQSAGPKSGTESGPRSFKKMTFAFP